MSKHERQTLRYRDAKLLGLWSNPTDQYWNMHLGHQAVADQLSLERYSRRIQQLPILQRGSEPYISEDVCSIQEAKLALDLALRHAGFTDTDPLWKVRAFKSLRRHHPRYFDESSA